MKRTMAPVLLATLVLSACADEDDGSLDPTGWQPGEGPAPSPTDEEPEQGTMVLNRYQDEEGYPDERPETYVATEFTSFTDMSWDEWSDEIARGSGNIAGTWCLNLDCDEDPYDVDVELHDPVEVDGVSYFSTYEVVDTGDMPEDIRQGMEAADAGRLTVPGEGGADGEEPEPAPDEDDTEDQDDDPDDDSPGDDEDGNGNGNGNGNGDNDDGEDN
ncbi:hypothetical protein [Nocardiopsis salina]|uniref:hypothetical protein n=1 Tax=Nocardiopsis salina TaxID=245836 RepID=UPI0003462A46|nr:hypothetical protein [Nocardiopsis salina]